MGIREDDSLAFALQAVAGATLSTQVLVVITTISSILSLLKVTENMVHPGGFEGKQENRRTISICNLMLYLPR